MRKVSYILISIIAAQAVLTHSSYASLPTPTPTKVPKPECRLEVDDAHISTTLSKHRKINAVKVNVKSICNVSQSQVLITLEIHKKGELGDHVYGPFTNMDSKNSNSGLEVDLNDIFVICTNKIPTIWFGIAFAKAFIAGKWQYAGKTESPHPLRAINCGT